MLPRIREFIHTQLIAIPMVARSIAILSVDKFPYPRKQTRGKEFILCSNDLCHILKRFHSESQLPLLFCLNHCIKTVLRGRIKAARKSDAGRPWSPYYDAPFLFISHSDDVKRKIRVYILATRARFTKPTPRSGGSWCSMTCIYYTVISQSEARVSTEHGIKLCTKHARPGYWWLVAWLAP